jgi:hypothetical protein
MVIVDNFPGAFDFSPSDRRVLDTKLCVLLTILDGGMEEKFSHF